MKTILKNKSSRKVRKTKNKSETSLRRAYRYRIYPDKEQQVLISKTFGCARFIWNRMLSDKMDHYSMHHETLHNTPAQYKEEFPWLREVDSLALSNVQMDLQQSYKNWLSNPKHFGAPKFKKKRYTQSYKTNLVGKNIVLGKNGVRLPKLGVVKAKVHRLPDKEMNLKSATVIKSASGKYYISMLYEKPFLYPETVPKETAKAVGFDYKSDGLYMSSDGEICGSPKYYRRAHERLAKAQRSLARKNKGSANYEKQRRKVALIHEHIANQRRDFLQKKSAEIANRYDIVCVEGLNMKALSNKGFGNGKATLDNGWGEFIRMLSYKLKEKGGAVVTIDKWYPSSQICHACGTVHEEVKDLSIREWTCPDCGTRHDRDENAAINILCEGLRTYITA